MSHPLRKYVRAVQDEFTREGRTVGYQFLLTAIQKHFEAARTTAHAADSENGAEMRARLIVALVDLIRPVLK